MIQKVLKCTTGNSTITCMAHLAMLVPLYLSARQFFQSLPQYREDTLPVSPTFELANPCKGGVKTADPHISLPSASHPNKARQ